MSLQAQKGADQRGGRELIPSLTTQGYNFASGRVTTLGVELIPKKFPRDFNVFQRAKVTTLSVRPPSQMGIFDESDIEASHNRLASSIHIYLEALCAATDLIRKALILAPNNPTDAERAGDLLAGSVLGYRVVNDAGAATKLVDCGYFAQGSALFRDIAEIGMLALLFSKDPGQLREWRKAGEKRYGQFSRGQMKVKVGADPEFLFFNNYFDVFSQFGTHPSAESIYFHIENDRFQIGPHYNENLYIKSYHDLAILVCRTTQICGFVYKSLFNLDAEIHFPVENKRFTAAWNVLNKVS